MLLDNTDQKSLPALVKLNSSGERQKMNNSRVSTFYSNPLQCSRLESSLDRVAWWATVRGVPRVGHDLATEPPTHHHILGRAKLHNVLSQGGTWSGLCLRMEMFSADATSTCSCLSINLN